MFTAKSVFRFSDIRNSEDYIITKYSPAIASSFTAVS
jgi:hypothetical protein